MEVAVNELIMISGKPRDQCVLALRAAYGNPDRAFEFLLSGVNLSALSSGGGAGIGSGAEGGAAGEEFGDDYGDEEGSNDPSAGGNPFAFLQQNPNFAMIRQRILQDPQFYQQFMQQLSQTQPQIYQLIQQNPSAFMNLILGGDAALGGGAAGVPGAGVAGGAHSHGGQGQPGAIRVTQEEMDAINRLVSLGFPKHRAAEAYFACDKNEEMAANYLFETGVEDEEAQLQESIAQSTQAQ